DIPERRLPLMTCGRIARVPDGVAAGQLVHNRLLGEVVADMTDAPYRVEAVLGRVAYDARRLLAAVLQRMKPKRDIGRGVLDAEDPVDPALLVQLVVPGRALARGHQITHAVFLLRAGQNQRDEGDISDAGRSQKCGAAASRSRAL